MPLRLDVRKKLSSRSDRVKAIDLHPTEPWICASLYNGNGEVQTALQSIASFFIREITKDMWNWLKCFIKSVSKRDNYGKVLIESVVGAI